MLLALKLVILFGFISSSAAASNAALEDLWNHVLGTPEQTVEFKDQKQACAAPKPTTLHKDTLFYHDSGPSSTALETRYPSLLVFVSTSMGETALESLAKEARALMQQHPGLSIALVLRGLIDKSLKKTVAFIHSQGVDVLIDPTLFRRFKVTQVPVLVLHDYKGIEPIESKIIKVDKATGNIKIKSFLNMVSDRGETSVARSLKTKGSR